MTFDEYYKLPLKTDDGIFAFTSDGVMALSRVDDFSEQEFRDVIEVLNGNMATPFDNVEYDYVEQQIIVGSQIAMNIRGWGGLLYKVGKDRAIEIQDEFGDWAAEKLGNYVQVYGTTDYWGKDALNAPLRKEIKEQIEEKLFSEIETSDGNKGLVVGLEIHSGSNYLIVLDTEDERIEYLPVNS